MSIRRSNHRFLIKTHTTEVPGFASSPVGSLCHTRGVVRLVGGRRLSSVVRRVSSVSTITTRNN